MHALQLSGYSGAATDLQLVTLPLPQPGPGEVLVRIAATPINPSDLMFLRGTYGVKKPLPVVPGIEGSGVVVAAGPGLLSQRLLGQRVACVAPATGDGTWAEYMRTAATLCFPLAKNLSLAAGATLIVNPITAWALLDIARRQRHPAIIQTAAASQVGRMVLRLGQRMKLPVINIVHRAEQVEMLRALGAPYVLNSSLPGFAADLRQVAAHLGATLAFDAVAGPMTSQLLSAMPPGSQALIYGGLSAAACEIPYDLIVFERKSVAGFWLSDWIGERTMIEVLRLSGRIQRLVRSDLAATVQARVPLTAAAQGLAQYQQQMSSGKVLFVPNNELL
jgi:NADPH:quinone reductase-like Zn-dependent oxidoreductase